MIRFFSLLLLVAFSSCATQHIYMSVLEPAPVDVPPDIKKVGIIDRSIPSKESKADAVDKVLSLESKELDEEGAKEAILGLQNELLKNERFDEVKILDTDLKTTGAGVFPAALSWGQAESLRQEYSVDALFVLELYDTDTKVSYSANPTNVSTPLGNIPAVEHQANMLTSVHAGWRIYDPRGRSLLDEFRMEDAITFTGRGINPVKAAAALIGRDEAVKRVSNRLGEDYAIRIIPYYIRVTRDYFVKGNNNFKIAKRKARTGNWEGAAEIWLKETENSNPKLAGRACMNTAIIEEMNGNLPKAMEWARKSYEDYNIRKANDYTRVLKKRIAKQERLDWQQQK